MNKTVTASEANRQFSKLLRNVGKGDTYTITSHGEAVATLAPPAPKPERERERAKRRLMAWLQSLPTQDIGPWSREELYDEEPK